MSGCLRITCSGQALRLFLLANLVLACSARPSPSNPDFLTTSEQAPAVQSGRREQRSQHANVPRLLPTKHLTFNQSWLTCWKLQPIVPAAESSSNAGNNSKTSVPRRPRMKRVLMFRQELNNHIQNISTPRFPQPYPENYECSWTFSVPVGYNYRLLITHAEFDEDLEQDCNDDPHAISHVQITEVHQRPTVVRKLCGRNNSRTHLIRGGYRNAPIVHIRFRSSAQVNHSASGFRAVFFSFPRRALFPIHVSKHDAPQLERLAGKCARPTCSVESKRFVTHYYSASQVKTLLRSVLRDENRSLTRTEGHICHRHSLIHVLADSVNATFSGWVKNHPCD